MENVFELIRARRSVRSFDGQPLGSELTEKLRSFMDSAGNPYGIPVEFKLLDPEEHGLTSPVISGATMYFGAKVSPAAHMEEAYGYSFEAVVLYAQSLGLGTTWIGGTMDRKAFERAMDLQNGEIMPCVSPIGFPAAKMSLKESLMRKGVKADKRLPFGELFFDGAFGTRLTEERAGAFAEPLEAVRLAPSAVNKQPWRAVVSGNCVHFYEKHSRGYVSDATGDLQRIDVGIALCHFTLAAQEKGLAPLLSVSDPGILSDGDTEYIATFTV